jgi:hypothetical protein
MTDEPLSDKLNDKCPECGRVTGTLHKMDCLRRRSWL